MYPTSVQDAYTYINNWKQDKPSGNGPPKLNSLAFATTEQEEEADDHNDAEQELEEQEEVALATAGKPSINKKKNRKKPAREAKKKTSAEKATSRRIECNQFGEPGYFRTTCPVCNDKSDNEDEDSDDEDTKDNKRQVGFAQLTAGTSYSGEEDLYGLNFHTRGTKVIPRTWILLDSQSTIDVFVNPNLLHNIHNSNQQMTIRSHGGHSKTCWKGTLPGYGSVWYDPQGIANIISLANMRKKFKVTYDEEHDGAFRVKRPDLPDLVFVADSSGLHVLDTQNVAQGIALATTVAEANTRFTKREIAQARLARRLQNIVGHPSNRHLEQVFQQGGIHNCPVNIQDLRNANDIMGPSLGALKGKTVRVNPNPVKVNVSTNVPRSILERYQEVTIATDVMQVNRIPFLMTISKYIKLGTAQSLNNQSDKTLWESLTSVFQAYQAKGFRVSVVLGDGQFESLRDSCNGIGVQLNTCAPDEHVPEAERYNRVVKERVRGTYNTLPFSSLPKAVVIRMVYDAVLWLNFLPNPNSVCGAMSPRTVFTGMTANYQTHCRAEFGEYAQVHEEHDNSMKPRTIGAICLGCTGNQQGSYYFLSLNTGKVITRRSWTNLPMPSEVIDRIHQLAQGQPDGLELDLLGGGSQPIIGPVNREEQESYHPADIDPEHPYLQDLDHLDIDRESVEANEPVIPGDIEPEQENEAEERELDQGAAPANPEEAAPREPPEPPIEAAPPAVLRRSTRERRAPQRLIESDILTTVGTALTITSDEKDFHNIRPIAPTNETEITNLIFTQYHVNKGLKVFGKSGEDAIVSEVKQLDDMKVLEPTSELTRAEKLAALRYLMFLKKKRCGRIKGRGCADGRPQRKYIPKEKAASPTVSTESLFLSCTIDALERREVATCDVPGAFMHAKMKEKVHLKLEGPMVKALILVNPKMYRKHVMIERGRMVLYARMVRALYGTLTAALRFWEELVEFLESIGFELNPYDRCVANKVINGKQCTVVWHVDDLKISHVDKHVVDNIIAKLQERYGTVKPLTVTRGKVHEYLGMTLDFSQEGKVKIRMEDYLEKIFEDLPENMLGSAVTPASNKLFEVSESAPKLDEERASYFHQLTAKLLFLCKRSRPDIHTAVTFLSTRVKSPTVEDEGKLIRVLKYLQSTKDLHLTLEGDHPVSTKWWVDGAFAVHPNMRSHSGITMSLGKGSVCSISTKQKLNTRSSTEAELVATNDALGQILWTRLFLEAQGYGSDPAKLYQDNKSAILLEENGRASSSKRTRHIHIRYFFIKDRVDKGEIRIEYCPTGEMVADFFTKPLQGTAFRKFRDTILNVDT